MILPGFKRLMSTDFPAEQRTFLDKFSFLFNNGIEVLYNALNRNVTLKDNIKCVVKDVSVTVNSAGTPLTQTGIISDLGGNSRIIGLNVLKVDNLTNTNNYPSAVFINWVQQNNLVLFNNVSGLTAGNTYSIRVVAYSE